MAIPSFETPKSSGGYDFGSPATSSGAAVDDDVEPQEIRDERAKGAASIFKDADKEAKVSALLLFICFTTDNDPVPKLILTLLFVILLSLQEAESVARALRNTANEKKKVAKELKDDACKTRVGGKFLCFRPLNSGY